LAELRDPRAAGAAPPSGLLVDWGGVMTTDLLGSFEAFCQSEGLDSGALRGVFRASPEAQELLFAFEEGRLEEPDFECRLAALLGVGGRHEGLIDRLFAGSLVDDAMVAAVRAARARGVRTGLISNSWGLSRYPRPLLAELFDGVVISGEIGLRKPAAHIYELGAQAIGRDPSECVFVDDLPHNLAPALELGMVTIRHVAASETVPALEALFGIDLAVAGPAPA
jgi:putative hydrolase of the HAD superfamily